MLYRASVRFPAVTYCNVEVADGDFEEKHEEFVRKKLHQEYQNYENEDQLHIKIQQDFKEEFDKKKDVEEESKAEMDVEIVDKSGKAEIDDDDEDEDHKEDEHTRDLREEKKQQIQRLQQPISHPQLTATIYKEWNKRINSRKKFKDINDEELTHIDANWLDNNKFDFSKDQFTSLNCEQFVAKYDKLCHEVRQFLIRKEKSSFQMVAETPLVGMLQAIGVAPFKTKNWIASYDYKFIFDIAAHFVKKFQAKPEPMDEDNEEKKVSKDDPYQHESHPNTFSINFKPFIEEDQRLRFVYAQLFRLEIWKELVTLYGEEEIKIREFGVTMLLPPTEVGWTHNDYEGIPIEGLFNDYILIV